MSGKTMVVGAEGGAGGAGRAYVYTRGAAGWTRAKTLASRAPSALGRFGSAVAVDGTVLMVGEPGCDQGLTNAGCVDVWTRSGATWSFTQRLAADYQNAEARFGTSIALVGDRVVIGSPGFDAGGNGTADGASYVFARGADGRWTEEKRFIVPGSLGLGQVVAMRGDVLALAAPATPSAGIPRVGTVYVYAFENTQWRQKASLVHPSGEQGSELGSSLAFFRDQIVVGARYTTIEDVAFGGRGLRREPLRDDIRAQPLYRPTVRSEPRGVRGSDRRRERHCLRRRTVRRR